MRGWRFSSARPSGSPAKLGASISMNAAWAGSMFPQGAELIRATYPKWKQEDRAAFSKMLNRAFLPILHNRLSYGNRELAVINALMAIGVFNDDRGAFLEGLSNWVSYVPCWIYLKEDGPTPIKPDYWLHSPGKDVLAEWGASLLPDPAQVSRRAPREVRSSSGA